MSANPAMVLPMIMIIWDFDSPVPSAASGDVEETSPCIDKLEAAGAGTADCGTLRATFWTVGEVAVEVEIDVCCNIEDVADRLEERSTVTVAGEGCGVGVGVGFMGVLPAGDWGTGAVVDAGDVVAMTLLPWSSNVTAVVYSV